ncbi:hypothetical protein [Streptomyces kanamyceticus]|uniref:Uncharacterized protein n=1 Tax=Streptomyces kanamyceticus TaxID=1967 RepID=A0A5J6GR60_STRKN|nr:hypothetical protein [Streptomyces kanamyceticus]QEU96892.1 hypothetical protein CP970_43475 [Streptomyces kanamyceticus]
MGNVFAGGERSLYLSNGGTEVFVDVLMLAVSDLADDVWDHRFAALLTLQDQNVMGRGAVGFDLRDIAWGASAADRARSKDFVLRATALALSGHRWDELGYEPPFARDYLRQFTYMVTSFVPTEGPDPGMGLPGPDDRAVASCARHRILSALPHWQGCFLCNRPCQEWNAR